MMRRGWCPTVFAPMPSGDGLLVRVKPPGGRLVPAQARALAAAAVRDGNGAIELTARGNLQVRGLSAASAPRFAQAMVAAGLAVSDIDAERRRNVAVAPLADAETRRIAAELEVRLLADGALAALPGKFGFAVVAPEMSADVRLHRVDGAWLVWPDGATVAVASDDPAEDALRLARAFLAVAPAARRMRDVAADAVFAAAGLRPFAALPEAVAPCVIGPLDGGFGVGLPFGATDARALAALAEAGTLWVTPWRAVVVAPDGGWAAVRNVAVALGLIVDPADPRLVVAACPGRPACASAHADVREDAAFLARLFPGLALHVSGCAKGCAHLAPAAVTLVAGADGYALVRDGSAADTPLRGGLTVAAAAAMIAP